MFLQITWWEANLNVQITKHPLIYRNQSAFGDIRCVLIEKSLIKIYSYFWKADNENKTNPTKCVITAFTNRGQRAMLTDICSNIENLWGAN